MAVGTKARGWGWAGLEAAVEKQRADRPMGPFSLDSVDDGLLRAASRRKLGVRIVGVDGGRMEREAVTAAARDGPSSELATARPWRADVCKAMAGTSPQAQCGGVFVLPWPEERGYGSKTGIDDVI